MKDKPNKLDDIIREKMNDLGAPYRPETWDWLNDRLDAQDTPADPLDNVVRDKLAHLAAPYRPETWDWMNERLEDIEEGTPADAEMQPMDEAIYERMHRLEKNYDPNHWPLLLKKLEGNVYVGERIIRYKAMELSLLVLLLITFIRLPFTPQPGQSLPAQPAPQALPQASKESTIRSDESLVDHSNTTLSKDNLEEFASVAGEAAGDLVAPLENNQDLAKVSQDDKLKTAYSEWNSMAVSGNKSKSDLPDNEQFELSQLPAATRALSIPDKKLPLAFTPNPTGIILDAPVLGMKPGQLLGVMTYLPTGLVSPICLTCSGKLDKKALAGKQTTFFRIGMQGGPDYNRVITPPTMIKGENYQADRYSLGYSGGLTLGLEKGRWEIETGLIYSNKRYYALPVLVLDGSVEDGFFGDGTKQFDLDVFQVPLNFRYNFIRKNRWRVYAMGGMSLHVTTLSNYYLAEANGFVTEDFRPQPTRPDLENHGRNAPSIKSEFDNFTKGWLEGGAFNENTYLTGNAGFGIERFITDYWSIYAQPTYSHSLIYLNDGLGPYYDRIHSNSLIFGVKVRLK